jgi:hypothetical protein
LIGKQGFKIYSHATTVYLTDKLQVLLLPWISSDRQDETLEKIAASKAKLVFAHLELAGFEMSRGQMMDHGMKADLFKKFKAVYTGHYHHKSSKGNIHYVGAPYEMTWADFDDQKGFHVLDTDTMKVEFVPNPITLFQKVHYQGEAIKEDFTGKIVKVIVHDRTDVKKFDKFMSSIEQNAVDMQVMDEHLHVDEAGQEIAIDNVEDTLKILNDYVMSSDFDVDKDELVKVLKELYVEANTESQQ